MEDLSEKRSEVEDHFRKIYGREPRLFRAPGRINFIGEHTDYNEGFVLPFAIDREVIVAATPRTDLRLNVHALDIDESTSVDLSDASKKPGMSWVNYVLGTASRLARHFEIGKGADIVFGSTVPTGAGLSSSAALEVSIGYTLLALNDLDIDGRKLAFAAQEAEHQFVGVRTGIMDQFASVFGRAGHALLLDCRSLEIAHIPFDLHDAIIVACDTGVKHSLVSSEYNTRRSECEEGVELLKRKLPGITSLRDVSIDDLTSMEHELPDKIRRRCRHVVTENTRTLAAAEAVREADLFAAGQLMYESHRSLRDDYEVSCIELDTLVETARTIDGVYGARMTGGGFGGCTINLISSAAFEIFGETVHSAYLDKFGFPPIIYRVYPSDGAGEIL